MPAIQVTVRGDKEVASYLKNIVRKTPQEGDRLCERLCRKIVKIAKSKVAPLRTGTGALKRSIHYKKVGDVWTVSAGEGLKRPYAYYQEFGFMGHWIHRSMLPHGSKGKWGRKDFFYVSHYFPYMSPAYRKVLARIRTELNRTANKIVGG
jgi:hypothetical protein